MDIEQEMRRLQDIEADYKSLLKSFTETTLLRDQFAMAALPAKITDAEAFNDRQRARAKGGLIDKTEVAHYCYLMADAMLAERSKQ